MSHFKKKNDFAALQQPACVICSDVNECNRYPYLCRNGGTCTDQEGSYRCECTEYWTGKDCYIRTCKLRCISMYVV